ncbi:DUF1007 family protein [uncultured Parvibaculum sp.]|uniref:DUF1007 family protein n=1 Tax=uncultured Parvibaculum sp. TaxID=291828 RepID=UPI0030D803F1|tara:strand:+ start:44742 stop:45419 length:678 start_codon:yes stop_codon:yes gene_type:complete
MVNFSFGSAVRILPLLAAMLGGIATAGPAVAHPHVWIDLKTEAHIDGEGRFAALTIVWIFDEFYSAFALDGLEKPGGAYKPEDLAALTDVNMTNLEEWNYFAEVTRGGETAKFGKPRDAHSAWDEKSGRLTLTFTLPLEEPQLATAATPAKFRVFDPSYYISIDYVEKDPLRLVGAAADRCATRIETPNVENVWTTLPETAFTGSQTQFGEMFAATATLTCQETP